MAVNYLSPELDIFTFCVISRENKLYLMHICGKCDFNRLIILQPVYCTFSPNIIYLFQPLAVKNIRELIFLPGSIVTALQVCFLARKLTNKGHLTKITFQAKSVLLPKYLKLDESQMTIPRTTVEMLSIETHTTIDEIDYVARHMKIKKLNLVVR